MPKNGAQLGIRVTKDLKARLEQQARGEMKSVSALVVQVMEEYLASKGNRKRVKKSARRKSDCAGRFLYYSISMAGTTLAHRGQSSGG